MTKKIGLYIEAATILRDVLDPPARTGMMRRRPFNGSTADRVDALWGRMETLTLEEAKELFLTYEACRLRGGMEWGIPTREKLKLNQILIQLDIEPLALTMRERRDQ